MSVNNISFILHKPQLSENIGACARGMKNFNFNKLIVIDPKPIFPNDKILATSVGAKNIINKAKNFENLEKSLQNIDVVIAIGSVIRGETSHFEFICQSTTNGIKDLNVIGKCPVILCLLTDNSLQQALDRSGGKYGNKGTEAAIAAIKMSFI